MVRLNAADTTTWQDIAQTIGGIEDAAGHVAPLIALIVQLAPLL
jgi:hypothetical protein